MQIQNARIYLSDVMKAEETDVIETTKSSSTLIVVFSADKCDNWRQLECFCICDVNSTICKLHGGLGTSVILRKSFNT